MTDIKNRVMNALDQRTPLEDLTRLFAELENSLRAIIESVKSTKDVALLKAACDDLDSLKSQIGEFIGTLGSWKPKPNSDPIVVNAIRECIYHYQRFLVTLSEAVDTTKTSFIRESALILKEGLLNSID